MIRLSKSCIGEAEKEAVLKVLEKEYLGMGEEVQAFEQALSALIDLDDAESRLTPKTRAIMPVFYAGNPGHYSDVYEFARKHGLRVIEDAAHAFGCSFNGTRIGSKGDVACFSFDGIKNITSGEGGAIVTEDKSVIEHVRDARLLGIENDTEARYQNRRTWEFDVRGKGWRYHMSNLNAAIGLEQLKRFEILKEKRQTLSVRYTTTLSRLEITVPELASPEIVPHIFPVRIPEEKRNRVKDFLAERGIQTGIHYFPNHRLSFFAQKGEGYPVADCEYRRLLTLPLHPDLRDEDIDFICASLSEALNA